MRVLIAILVITWLLAAYNFYMSVNYVSVMTTKKAKSPKYGRIMLSLLLWPYFVLRTLVTQLKRWWQ